MSKGIPVSPKHGVNPTMPICFFCGEPTGEIALLGRLKGDVEAPKHMLLDYRPCQNCEEQMKKGICFIAVSTKPVEKGQPPIQKEEQADLYPTGPWCVVKDEAVRRIFTEEVVEQIMRKRRSLVDDEMYHRLFDVDGENKESEPLQED